MATTCWDTRSLTSLRATPGLPGSCFTMSWTAWPLIPPWAFCQLAQASSVFVVSSAGCPNWAHRHITPILNGVPVACCAGALYQTVPEPVALPP